MRVGINLLTDDPANPSGAHWFWTRIIPEMAKLLDDQERFYLLTSPRSRPMHEGYGENIRYITYPWSNERRTLRTLSEHLYSPLRLPPAGVNVLNTLMAPLWWPAALVAHIKTMHAYTAPGAVPPAARLYRRMSYPRTMRLADAVIINSESLRREIHQFLEADDAKLHLVPEAVDHELFRPGDRAEAAAWVRGTYGVDQPFILFVSSLWPYKNCDGLIKAYAAAKDRLGERLLVIVGPDRDTVYAAELHDLAGRLGVARDLRWIGGVPLDHTAHFYRAADVLAYPSRNETFGLPLLEAMACGCPVVTSNVSAMPETTGGAALLADPSDPASIAAALVEACGARNASLREQGLARAAEFSWTATAEKTLAVYREVHARRTARAPRSRAPRPLRMPAR